MSDDHLLWPALDAARNHGMESEPDHEIGDLQDLLFELWKHTSKRGRSRFLKSDTVRDLMKEWTGLGDEEDEDED